MVSVRNLVFVFAMGSGAAVAQDVTIAALGDSLTQGYGLAPEKGFVPRLEDWLSEQGQSVSIINAGVSGDTSAGGLARVSWTLTDNVEGLIVALGGNDVLRGFAPSETRANLAGILAVASENDLPVLLIGMEAPANFGAEYKDEFDAIFPTLATEYSTLVHPNFLRALTAENDLPTALSKFMQPDGIHPNADGISLIVEDIGPFVVELVERIEN